MHNPKRFSQLLISLSWLENKCIETSLFPVHIEASLFPLDALDGAALKKQVDQASGGSFFHNFYIILHFNEFCRMRYFKFLNFILIKNLEIHFSFFRIF
jgi:hypothetical protein